MNAMCHVAPYVVSLPACHLLQYDTAYPALWCDGMLVVGTPMATVCCCTFCSFTRLATPVEFLTASTTVSKQFAPWTDMSVIHGATNGTCKPGERYWRAAFNGKWRQLLTFGLVPTSKLPAVRIQPSNSDIWTASWQYWNGSAGSRSTFSTFEGAFIL